MPILRKRLTTAVIASAIVAIMAPLPLSSTAAQTVPTRLGDLTLENGFPSRQTADRLYDEMDFQREVDAII